MFFSWLKSLIWSKFVYYEWNLVNKMTKLLPFAFALSIFASPVYSWGGGECPYSKNGDNQQVSNEKAEESESLKQKWISY